jgi:hypothetical protein
MGGLGDPASMADEALLKQIAGKAGIAEGLVPEKELLTAMKRSVFMANQQRGWAAPALRLK